MTTLPLITFLDQARSEGELKSSFYGPMLDVAAEQPGGGALTGLTIAAGSITPPAKTARHFRVDTEAAAASDDLTHIDQTNSFDGAHIWLRVQDNARTVKVIDQAGGTGSIILGDARDFLLDNVNTWLHLIRVGTLWREIDRHIGIDGWSHKRANVKTITAAKTLIRDDDGNIHKCDATAGAFTVTLPPVAGVPKGALYGFKRINGGANKVTIDGNAAELVNELDTTFELLTEDHIVWFMNNTASWTLVWEDRPLIREIFTATGIWTRPKGLRQVNVKVQGGGGAGGKGDGTTIAGGGGAGGSYGEGIYDVSASATVAVTVGAGGAAATVASTNGGNGATSSFAAFLSAAGGSGGLGNGTGSGSPSAAAGADWGAQGSSGGSTSAALGGNGGAAHLGGRGRGGTTGAVGGGLYGAGGGGTNSGASSGAGAGGIVIVEY